MAPWPQRRVAAPPAIPQRRDVHQRRSSMASEAGPRATQQRCPHPLGGRGPAGTQHRLLRGPPPAAMQQGALPAEWRAGGVGGNAPAAPQGEATGSDIGALQPDGAADAAVDVGAVTEDREAHLARHGGGRRDCARCVYYRHAEIWILESRVRRGERVPAGGAPECDLAHGAARMLGRAVGIGLPVVRPGSGRARGSTGRGPTACCTAGGSLPPEGATMDSMGSL